MERQTDKLLSLANDLESCLREAETLDASFAAIKIVEAQEAILALADNGPDIELTLVGNVRSAMPEFEGQS